MSRLLRQLGTIAGNELIFIACVFIPINAALYYKNGVKVVADSERYIEYAITLRNGFYFDPHNFWYIGYSLYIMVVQHLHGDVLGVVVGQYLFSLLAVIALYHTSLELWNNKLGALCTSLCYLLFIEISSWNSYILAESLYTSFTCFSLYCLACVSNGKAGAQFITGTVAVILFTIFLKPTGIALAGALLWVLTFKFVKQLNSRLKIILSLVFIGSCFLYLVNQRLSTYRIIENYQLGEVIYGVTTISDHPEVKMLILTPPENIYRPVESLPPLLKIILFFFHHPLYWFKLFFVKAFYFLLHIRPFWSIGHNLFSLIILLSCYGFFLKTLLTKKSKSSIVLFSSIYLLIHVLSVCMTSEDWDGRFLMPMLPVIFIFTGHGISTWLRAGLFKISSKSLVN